MRINDALYGEFHIEAVLAELIQSWPVQRLKGIHQGGASYLVNRDWNITRYEHSLGVMLLIRRLGGSLEEQVAGLLHDVSHTTFSHVIDFALDNNEEDYHEEIYQHVIIESEIPTILQKYGYDYRELLLDDSKWTLLEQPAPELCADRLDYTLRDMHEYGKITLEEAHRFLDGLVAVAGKMYIHDILMAEWFVETYYKEVIDFFMDPLNIYGNDRLAKTLKLALDKHILTIEDLLGTDKEVMDKLKMSGVPEIKEQLSQIHPQVNVIEDTADYHFHRKNKLRLMDPSILQNGELIKASTLSRKVKEMRRKAVERANAGVYVKVVSY